MAKKLSIIIAAVAVLAFAIPAAASATIPTLQYVSNSQPVPVGKNITGTGKNVILTSSLLGEIKCEVLNLKGTVSENDMTNGIDGKGTKEKPKQEKCSNPNGEVTVNFVTLNTLQSRSVTLKEEEEKVGTAKANFEANVTIGTLVCTFVGTNVEGKYANGGEVLTFEKAGGITASPSGCGTVKLDGKFTLEEIEGTTVKALKAAY